MSEGARVTVGMPVCNGERYLALAIESFLAQSAPFRLFVVDNASSDGTGAIAQRYADRDPRVRYVRNPVNLGVAGNYRRALALADTAYFRWAAADDLAGPEALARAVVVLDRDPGVVLVYPKSMFIGPDGQPLRPYDDGLHMESQRPSARFRQVMAHVERTNALYGVGRTAVLKRLLPLGSFRASDYCWLGELSLHGRFYEIPDVLFFRRLHETASSSLDDVALRQYYRPNVPRNAMPDLFTWKQYARHVRAVIRSPIGTVEKWRTLSHVGRRAIWQRDHLAREVGDAIGWIWRAARGALGNAPSERTPAR